MTMLRFLLALFTALTLTACAGEPIACGSTSCTGGEICVRPCCGGAPPQCITPDAGGCPAGTTVGTCFRNGSPSSGCVEQCVPAAPFCRPTPTSSEQPCGPGGGQLRDGVYNCICA